MDSEINENDQITSRSIDIHIPFYMISTDNVQLNNKLTKENTSKNISLNVIQ